MVGKQRSNEPESDQWTGAELIARRLRDLGVRHAFGIVSIHNMPIIDAVNSLGYTRMIDSRHECAAAHSADGYARATGGIGVVIASTGPGTTNTVTGLYEAAYANSRLLVITGQAETRYYGKGMGYVHEAENQLPMLATVARRVESPRSVDQIGPCFDAVVDDMSSGRWQPGAIEIPIDLQYQKVAGGSAIRANSIAVNPETSVDSPVAAQVSAAADLLGSSRRRVLLVGGGAMGAAQEVCALAEALALPIVTTPNGRGVVPEDHELCVGNFYQTPDMAKALIDSDLTIAVGTRFQMGVDGRNAAYQPSGKLLHIDIDNRVLGLVHRADVEVLGDAKAILTALNSETASLDANDAQFNAGIMQAGEALRQRSLERLGPDFRGICDALSDSMQKDTVLVRDNTIAAYFMANQLIPVRAPRCSISPVSGAIGPGLPLGIGAAAGTGKRTLVIHGDGGFMFHATELATAAQYQLPVTVCIFNDGGYGILRALQRGRFDGRINETDLGFMDFTAMAASMGCPGERVDSVAGLTAALAKAQQSAGPYVIDIDLRCLELIGGMQLPADMMES